MTARSDEGLFSRLKRSVYSFFLTECSNCGGKGRVRTHNGSVNVCPSCKGSGVEEL